MIGQELLLNRLNQYTELASFPKCNLIIGTKGSGRHTFIDEILHKFNLATVNLNETANPGVPMASIIELGSLQEQEELKTLVEDPPY